MAEEDYMRKLNNKWYLFAEIPVDELLLFRISNSRKTITYKTTEGNFNYRTLKPAFYFGYRILHKDKLPVLIAEPEKALLDYLYLTASLNTIKGMKALRINYAELQQAVDWNKLGKYAQVFKKH